MSNYRFAYMSPGHHGLTPKQVRRARRKVRRDLQASAPPIAGSPKGVPGHPGRRREQIATQPPRKGSFETLLAVQVHGAPPRGNPNLRRRLTPRGKR